ncbi:hypothetical protein PIB30_079794 [Stylosanthes scabra]|uniref:Uncharacterized protein n=1 Tax=Stylosanthes scabra TaxID=79078 RepID=A0ABU6SSI3_9FABA|nr:hypothetical protein [Stylosanthes scabra]
MNNSLPIGTNLQKIRGRNQLIFKQQHASPELLLQKAQQLLGEAASSIAASCLVPSPAPGSQSPNSWNPLQMANTRSDGHVYGSTASSPMLFS